MLKTVTIDIINEKVMNLLRDLESLKLIRLRKDKIQEPLNAGNSTKYKGAMSKQPLADVDKQLNDLRNEWE